MPAILLLHSIKTRIFFAVTLILSMVAAVVTVSSQRALEYNSITAEERSVRNVLKLVEDNVRGRYRSLLKEKVAIVQASRQRFHEFNDVVRATLDQFAALADQQVVSADRARELALQWLAVVQPVDGDFLLVLDHEHRVLVSPDASQRGRVIDQVVDIKGRIAARAARGEIMRFNDTFLSFLWLNAEGGMAAKFGYFADYRRWGWVIGIVGDVDRVKIEARRQLAELRTELADTLPHIVTGGDATVFIFDGHGEMVVPPRDTADLVAMTAEVRTALMRVARQITGDEMLNLVTANGRELVGRATYIKPLDWYIAALASRDALREPARKLVAGQAGIFLGALAVGLILAYFFAHRIALPLNQLSAYAMKLPESDFSASDRVSSTVSELPIGRRDEIGQLAQAFVFMENSLYANVRQLMQAVSARERLEGELNVARDIQMNLLPQVFPPFPKRPEVDIHALIAPAREVGGDLYNFYFLDEHHLCFTMGDVSGKGVPAALFMTIVMTLIRVAFDHESDLGRIIDDVNTNISRNNPNCVFVTLVVGVLDVRTGRVRYVNAGHNPPLALHREGDIQVLAAASGPPAGLIDGIEFNLLETVLGPGDGLLLYTDGVTEALDPSGNLYGDARLRQLLTHCPGFTAEQVVDRIIRDVRDHAGEAEQSDDITVLAVCYRGFEQIRTEA
ncbi:MAG: SpoIIE family protein phosphatase [Candidatus Contendobacter sp.]|nr:SpoIIE family protein phosphatase [Candidatus Contendobacter sp.]